MKNFMELYFCTSEKVIPEYTYVFVLLERPFQNYVFILLERIFRKYKTNQYILEKSFHNRIKFYNSLSFSIQFTSFFALGLSAIVLGGCRSGVWVYSGIRWRQGLPRRGRDICLSFHVFHGCMKQKREMQEVKSMKRPLI